jgi:hypothetical protein
VGWIQLARDKLEWRILLTAVTIPFFKKDEADTDHANGYQLLKKSAAPWSLLVSESIRMSHLKNSESFDKIITGINLSVETPGTF